MWWTSTAALLEQPRCWYWKHMQSYGVYHKRKLSSCKPGSDYRIPGHFWILILFAFGGYGDTQSIKWRNYSSSLRGEGVTIIFQWYGDTQSIKWRNYSSCWRGEWVTIIFQWYGDTQSIKWRNYSSCSRGEWVTILFQWYGDTPVNKMT
jgi:hypothetical protein